MPIMLIQNAHIPHDWVNGTIALTDYIDEENICLKKFRNANDDEPEEQIYWIQRITRQVPGIVVSAFTSTIRKAQSATIDCVAIHLDKMLTHGQLYISMSRVGRADNLYFFGADLPISIKRKYDVDCDAVELVRKKVHIDYRP
ncbi:hypothetical protein RMATCC62417_07562 [Rhizopus microsporus]|nr:hypothetical protein RMATCC62417_07562 [Rhizopus microsporus]